MKCLKEYFILDWIVGARELKKKIKILGKDFWVSEKLTL